MHVQCVLAGDRGVGKTGLLVSYFENAYPGECLPIALLEKSMNPPTIRVDGQNVNLRFFETYDTFRPSMYRVYDPHVILLAFSIIDPHSFNNVKSKWYPELQQHAPGVPIILVGAKSDLRKISYINQPGTCMITAEEAQARAREIGAVTYLECSAVSQEGLIAVFDEVFRVALKQELKKKRGVTGCCVVL